MNSTYAEVSAWAETLVRRTCAGVLGGSVPVFAYGGNDRAGRLRRGFAGTPAGSDRGNSALLTKNLLAFCERCGILKAKTEEKGSDSEHGIQLQGRRSG